MFCCKIISSWKSIAKCLFRLGIINRRILLRSFLVAGTVIAVSAVVVASNCTLNTLPKQQENEVRVNCAKLIANDSKEMSRMNRTKFESVTSPLTISNCDDWISSRRYPLKPSSKKEENFPIAYSILLYNHVEQFERLLRAIYAPQNLYCVHVDRKADVSVHLSVLAITSCFANVFVASNLETVVYAGFSRLQADLNCFNDLLERDSKWRYLINLSGEMFPLKTNREIVEILHAYKGSNDILGFYGKRITTQEYKWKKKYKEALFFNSTPEVVNTNVNNTNPPHNIVIIKGSAYNLFSRPFVQFVMSDSIVKDFLEWTKSTYSPDEIFWASLQYTSINPVFKSPGGSIGDPHKTPWHAAYVKWQGEPDCGEKLVRGVCIPDYRKLPNLAYRKELFVNKLLIYNYDYTVLVCLDEWLRNRTRDVEPFDTSYYREIASENVR